MPTYYALYRRYRPSKFSEIVGQKFIISTIKNEIVNDRLSHAYIFCGPRGTGKTTTARIIAKSICCENFKDEPCNECENCQEIINGSHPDVIEIDAASNTGVDNIRNLIENVKYLPLKAKYKIYIIDEVHMLSSGAFNALLKTLEEPPKHVIFIMATTDPNKVLPTVLSRCQRFDFTKISENEIYEHLLYVCKNAQLNVTEKACHLIARLSDGGLRDALSILDQGVAFAPDHLDYDDVAKIYGLLPSEQVIDLMIKIRDKEVESIVKQISEFVNDGIDIKSLTSDILDYAKEASIYSYTKNNNLLFRINQKEAETIISKYNNKDLLALADLMVDALGKYRYAVTPSSYFIISILKSVESFNETMEKPVEQKEPKIQKVLDNSKVFIENLRKKELLNEDKKEEVIKDKIDDYMIDEEQLLEVLVAASKEEKKNDVENMSQLGSYLSDIETGKYANLLKQAVILASSEEEIIMVVRNQSVANMVNEANNEEKFGEMMEKLFKKEKYILCITEETSNDLILSFKKRREEGTLPQAKESKKVIPEEEKTETSLDKVIDLFGKDNVKIV